MSLLPPWLIGTGESALTAQAIQHWIHGAPDRFVWLHAHWLWMPYVIALMTQKPLMALTIFRAIMIGFTACCFAKTIERIGHGDRATTILGVALLLANVTVVYMLHAYATPLVTLFVAVILLYLLTSEKTANHRIAALIFGLSLSIGFWPFVLLLGIVTVGLNLHHETYTLRSKDTLFLFLFAAAGAASYLLLEIFLFGTSRLGEVLFSKTDPPREISLIAQGIVIAIWSANTLLVWLFKRGGTGLVREFQSAFVILLAFFLLNIFSREDMLHATMILVACLIVIAADKSEGKPILLGTSLIASLAFFFLLPPIVPDAQIALAPKARTKSSSDISLRYYGSANMFSFAKLLEESGGETEIRDLLRTQPLDSTLVLVMPGTDYWFDAGTLAVMYPNATFGWYYGNPINRVKINGLEDTTFIRPPAERPYLAAIFEKKFAHAFIDSAMPPSAIIRESERFQFLSTRNDPEARRMLIDRLIELQYHSHHH